MHNCPTHAPLSLHAGGMAEAQRLARKEADIALRSLEVLPEGPAKRSLQLMVDYVLYRLY